uniref:Putative rna-binding protein n=1 Tax=Lutzomyia longipalpis TaxID=7200 RepID=A0A1B0CI85_LUTLO
MSSPGKDLNANVVPITLAVPVGPPAVPYEVDAPNVLATSEKAVNVDGKECELINLHDDPAEDLTEIECERADEAKEMEDIPLNYDEEEHDSVSPLMMDNHTILEHHESYKELDEGSYEEDEDLHVYESRRKAHMKHSETKDSISSIDSDLSLSYDRHAAQDVQNLQTSDSLSSDENAKDSGCDVAKRSDEDGERKDQDEPPIEIPTDDMCDKIIEQVEFYFSNENILKDAFLLKHVRRNKEGFVSLKLVSSFKRVRQLVKDWRVVGYAIKKRSQKIELNDIGTKIRRLEPLPVYDETTPSRTVVATDLPISRMTIERVFDLFSKCGEIALVRILRVGGPIPADVRQFINKYPELQHKECALIEFLESQSARNAQAMPGMTVLEMVAPKKKTGKKAQVTRLIENCKVTEADIERSRGGMEDSFAKYRFRRSQSGYYAKPDQPVYVPPMRKMAYNNENYDHFNVRRGSAGAFQPVAPAEMSPPMQAPMQQQPMQQQPMQMPPMQQQMQPNPMQQMQPQQMVFSRNNSLCSDGYSSGCMDSRRGSQCSDLSRRLSNCSIASRRSSTCSECCLNCSRRSSQCSGPMDPYRRLSQCSEHGGSPRKYSLGQTFERRPSNGTVETNWRLPEDRIAESPISPRKFSGNGFDPMRKLSNGTEEYINGRRVSTDSGYDRKHSIGSDCSATRSRSGSFICGAHNPPIQEQMIVRSPVAPDGTRGFASRTRKMGQILPPV